MNKPSNSSETNIKELDCIRLKRDFKGIPAGTEGAVVDVYPKKHFYRRQYFEVEFFDAEGNTIDVLTTPLEFLELTIPYQAELREK